MDFRIADTFTDSLNKLTSEEQKATKTTAFDLQVNLSNPGLQFHRVDKAKDKNFWSVRVNNDIRVIIHKTDADLLLCYVDHHEKAYQWAQKRKLETHPKTGAAQLVEIRETVKEIVIPKYSESIEPMPPKPPLFSAIPEDDLLGYGVPEEWIPDVLQANEDTILDLADHLPKEAAEALLELAVGGTPQINIPPENTDPLDHPDAQRRFRVMNNLEELQLALDYPWEKWTIFLHPAQKDIVEKNFNGPARISGSAGTGKTIVALHRAVFLARNHSDARVLLSTFSEPLAEMLRIKLRRLISNEPRLGERLEVHALDDIGLRLYERNIGSLSLATSNQIKSGLLEASKRSENHNFSLSFLQSEWDQVVDAWQLDTWEDYRDVLRLGRKTRLREDQRLILWQIFEDLKDSLSDQGITTKARMFNQLAIRLAESKNPPFDYIILDESQDISVSQLRMMASVGGNRENSLFFAGDLGQRIFQPPFSWKALGVDVRGRSKTLRINYRTSHQIRTQADRLLDPEIADVDGLTEERKGTVSVFNGPRPTIKTFENNEDEIEYVRSWLSDRFAEGIGRREVGIFVRSEMEMGRVDDVLDIIDRDQITVCPMHLAKGLEFRAVVVMGCDDEIIPSQERIEQVIDDSDLEEVYNTERHLLYVACTRARDFLLLTSTEPSSEFLDDMRD